MTPHLIPLYGTSILTVGMLALFARHNRVTGWKKQPNRFSQFLGDYYAVAQSNDAVPAEAERSIPALAPHTGLDAVAFTAQLLKLRCSLGTAGTAPAFASQEAARHLVAQ